MTVLKKWFVLILSLMMLLPTIATGISAVSASGEINGSTPGWGMDYFYKDSYFEANASEYNPSLSTLSLCLACAGFASGSDYANCSKNGRAMLGQLGFDQIEVNEDYTKKPGTDTMGVIVANKKVTLGGDECTLLCVVPRSANYDAEWASNFTLGIIGEAQGFSDSAAIIEEFIGEYVAKYGATFESRIKIWVVGFSRGAAVANLVAGHITENGKVGTLAVAKEDVFGYTFETPRCASTDVHSAEEYASYTNIHNIITSSDLVTKVAPRNWGFVRYGTDESVIPDKRTAENESLYETMVSFLSPYYCTTDDNGKTISLPETLKAKKLTTDLSAYAELGTWVKQDGIYVWQANDNAKELLIVDSDKAFGDCVDDFLTSLATGVGSRYLYTKNVQDTIRLVMSEMLGGGYQTEVLNNAKAILEAQLEEYKESLLIAAFTGRELYLTAMLTKIVNTVISESGLDAIAYGKLPEQLLKLIPIFVNTMMVDVLIDNGTDIITLIENIGNMFTPHEPAICVAWMEALDPNYNPDVQVESAQVTDVNVTVTSNTVTRKFLFVKYKTTTYTVTIAPVADKAVREIAYRATYIGNLTTGNGFTSSRPVSYLYISVTDANGNVTHWTYENGKTTQVK